MRHMQGAVRSNWFRVHDFARFKTWFEDNVILGNNVMVYAEDGKVCIAGHDELYPSAYPQRPVNGHAQPWELSDFAHAICSHIPEDEEFRVISSGSEYLRYVIAEHLVISHKEITFNSIHEGK